MQESFVKEFDITGRVMTGWAMVEPEGIESDDELRAWVARAVKFVRTLPAKQERSGPFRLVVVRERSSSIGRSDRMNAAATNP